MPTPIGFLTLIGAMTVFVTTCRTAGIWDTASCVAIFGLVVYAAASGLFFGWLIVRRARAAPGMAVDPTRGVSILKPLCGLEDGLEENLESFLRLDHEPLQIVFGARRADDPALEVARRVAARHAQRDVTFVAGIDSDAANPKIAIDERLLPLARYDLVLLSDSNVRIGPGDLSLLLGELEDERTGMVYQPVVAVDEADALAALSNLRFTEHSGVLTVCARLFCGEDAITGKGMLCRRSALASIGDLGSVRDAGLDDYLLGVALKEAGWKIRLSRVPALNVYSHGSSRAFFDRQLRHAVWRLSLHPLVAVGELAMAPLVWSLAAVALGGSSALPAALATIAGKAVLEEVTGRMLRPYPFRWVHTLISPIKDLLMLLIWAVAAFRRTVVWRGLRYRVGRLSRLTPIPPPTEQEC